MNMTNPAAGRGLFAAAIVLVALLLSGAYYDATAQGIAQPLTIHGIDQAYLPGARARAMGGAFTAVSDDATAMLWNPSGLAQVGGLSVSAGAAARFTTWDEYQRWIPNRFYGGSSLYFKNPESYPEDPFENPDWSFSNDEVRLGHVAAAYPFSLAGRTVAFGLAYHQAVDLTAYDRNDNVVDPYIGTLRPGPIRRPVNPADSVDAVWSSFDRLREGAIYAISPAIAVEVFNGLRVGGRMSIWNGSSDDRESHDYRGIFTFRESAHDFSFRDSVAAMSWAGTSDYSGWSASLGLQFERQYFTIGLLMELPSEVTREWEREIVSTDPAGTSTRRDETGEETMTLPHRITFGATVRPSTSLGISFDYSRQDLSELELDRAGGIVGPAPAWIAQEGIRLGVEWSATDWLDLRGGYREDARPFAEVGSAFVNEEGAEIERARGSILSGGVGLGWQNVRVDATYEFHSLDYVDRWESNANHARERSHVVVFGISYAL